MTAAAPRVLFILGPTASGKSALAMTLAERTGGEILSADSQQVYVGMDIGTSKPTAAERARVPHHLIDLVRPDEGMTAMQWAARADAALADCARRGVPAIVAGGTGLYVRALRFGLFDGPPADPALRARLAAEAAAAPDGTRALHARLAEVDPAAAARIDANDLIRITRALEVHELTGVPISVHQAAHDHRRVPARQPGARVIGLAPAKDHLGARIDARVDEMLAQGLVAEVDALLARHPADTRAFGAIGYRELVDVALGRADAALAPAAIKAATRRYARRQRAWFAGEPDLSWYAQADDAPLAELAAFLTQPA